MSARASRPSRIPRVITPRGSGPRAAVPGCPAALVCLPGRLPGGRAASGPAGGAGMVRARTGPAGVCVVAGVCGRRPGRRRGAAQDGDRGREGRPGRFQAGREFAARAVTASPAGRGDHQGCADGCGQAEGGQPAGREADARHGTVMAVVRRSGGRAGWLGVARRRPAGAGAGRAATAAARAAASVRGQFGLLAREPGLVAGVAPSRAR